MKIIAVIPARISSTRFPGKILFPIHGLPMVEHVRRRSLLSCVADDVYVATCDDEIAKTVKNFGGKVIMTSQSHINGTSRVAEAVKGLDCTHVILLQGDEPLLLPRHIDSFVQAIKSKPEIDAWNATGNLEYEEELDRHSFVKCSVSSSGRILYCFRKTPCFSPYEVQKTFIKKMLGIIAFRKDFLIHLSALNISPMEESESIEQIRIIDNGYVLNSLQVEPSLPSINEPHEVNTVLNFINKNSEQQKILSKIIK